MAPPNSGDWGIYTPLPPALYATAESAYTSLSKLPRHAHEKTFDPRSQIERTPCIHTLAETIFEFDPSNNPVPKPRLDNQTKALFH
ncbi:hypothetical protein AVEN_153703-1 [Araneus ventricosus]|uniref:Uncharacterized protein n=1 Tax=Araneus ventricosus TaxID=182803 RepID=A0A4Y2G117_ARAVE|nr:hypothetical protein AVEN_153703-1 [Araneus ventricosus]